MVALNRRQEEASGRFSRWSSPSFIVITLIDEGDDYSPFFFTLKDASAVVA